MTSGRYEAVSIGFTEVYDGNCMELCSDVERSIEDVNVDVVLFLRCNSIESATKRVVRQTKRRTNIIHGIFHLQYC